MKIYIVTGGEYSAYHIEAVFLTKEKAELYIAAHEVWDGRVETYEPKDDDIHGELSAINYKYCVSFRYCPEKGWKDLTLHWDEYDVLTFDREGVTVKFSELFAGMIDANIKVVLKEKNAWDKAIKIGRDALFEELAKREGIA